MATIIAAYLDGRLGYDLRIIGDSKGELFLVLAGTFTFVAAKLFIGFSISQKNASLAGLIEISYPSFTAIFAGLLFREAEGDAVQSQYEGKSYSRAEFERLVEQKKSKSGE